MTEAQRLSPQEHYARRAKLIASASMIIRDPLGRVLLVHTTYGARLWELPGGGLEPGEYPAPAAQREVAEELGLDIESGRLLAADLVPYTPPIDDAAPGLLSNWLFDGGILEPSAAATIRLDPAEVDEARFCDQAEYHARLPAHMARRVDACLNAVAGGQTAYLQHGFPPAASS
ncbi:MAG TPA: NUDIX hydrolase [Pseudonocardiaceae bacterium]|jgi:8-oxo-dGTP pyrophosphatase MutT (NUDIX family)